MIVAPKPASSKGPMIIIGVLVVLVILFVIMFALAQSGKGGLGGSTPTPSTVPPPPPDPKTTLLGTGQAIQTSEIEIGTTVVPFATQPTLPTTASYSMTMDLLVAGSVPGWRCILNSSNAPDWVNNRPGPNTRRPLLGMTGTGAAPPANQVFLNHTNANGDWQGDWLWVGNERLVGSVPIGKYFNLTFTADSASKKATLYMNGVKVNEFTAGADFAWPSPATTWSWNNDAYDKTGSVKVKNAYFFNKVLTATDATTLAGGDAKTAVLADSQDLQISEVEISTAPPTFKAPTGILSDKCVYTCSMDINIAQTGPTWRNVFLGSDPDWPPGSTGRRPAMYITGNDAAPANRIHIVHGANEDQNKNIVTTFVAPTGTYFNVTWVVDGGRLITYINGVRDASGLTTGTFTWGNFAWKWNAYLAGGGSGNASGSVKVKNVRWWNRVLTAAEIQALTPASTTSTYATEPWEPFEW
jgi:Concanavalin A-like lectin/glucanases superfamily